MSSSVKRFELFRMLFAIAIALLVSFGIIFVCEQPAADCDLYTDYGTV